MWRPRPAVTLATGAAAMVIMAFPTWPIIYGLHTLMYIRWMGMFTTTYFVWQPLLAFALSLVATVMVAWSLPRHPSSHIPSLLYIAAVLVALAGMVHGPLWTAPTVIIIALLVACGALARRERPAQQNG